MPCPSFDPSPPQHSAPHPRRLVPFSLELLSLVRLGHSLVSFMECFHFSQLPSEFYSILFYIIKWNTFSSSLYSLYPSSPPPCLPNELFPRKRRSIKTFHSLSRSRSLARLAYASNCSFSSHSDVVASFPFRTPYLHLCTAATYIKRQKYCQALPFVCEFLKQLKELPPSSPPSPSPSPIETSILRSLPKSRADIAGTSSS